MVAKKKKAQKKHCKLRKVPPRIATLAIPKHFAPKVSQEPQIFQSKVRPSTLTGRIPERVLNAAYPYERILLDTRERFSKVLTDRSKTYINLVLSNTVNTIYNKLVKRPICMVEVPDRKPPTEWDPVAFKKHKERMQILSTPKKNFQKTQELEKRKGVALEKLMPRIEELAAPPKWRIYQRLSKDPTYRDPTKLRNRGALTYVLTERMNLIARPKKTDDMSTEGLISNMIWDRFIKKTNFLYQRQIIKEKLGLVK